MEHTGSEFTKKAGVVAAQFGDVLLVKVNVATPALTPVTRPVAETVATPALLLTQVPPELGVNCVVPPMQIDEAPIIPTAGLGVIVTAAVVAEQLGAVLLVKVNVTEPPDTPVTTPAGEVTVAIAGLLLTQVPPVVGDKVVVDPTQIFVAPVIPTTGAALTVTATVVAEQLGVVLPVKVNVADPADTPVTTPALFTVATAGLLLTQVPPEPGVTVVVDPTHKVALVKFTTGSAVTVTANVVAVLVPQLYVAVTEIFPFWPAAPPVTLIETVPCPDTIVHPAGTVHV